jgi:uncharacterized protein YrzB (UPF0473 family)
VQNGEVDEDGAESAFEVVCDINERYEICEAIWLIGN